MRHTLAAATIAFTALSGAAFGQTHSWNLANEYGDTSLMGEADKVFIAAVEEASKGDIKITGHFGGALGYKSVDQFDAVGDGALELADTQTSLLSGIEPIFLLSALPFAASSPAEAKLLFEVARPHYEATFDKHNQVLLWATPWPPAGIWANQPVTTIEDIKGLKVRGWDTSGVVTMSNAGAVAVQVSWADTVPQLAAGSLNSVLTSADGGASSKFWEFLSHFTAVNYSMSLNMVHMNKDVFDALSAEEQQIIRDAADKASTAAWAALEERVTKNYADMTANGMTIVQDIPAETLEHLRVSGKPVYDDWLKQVGPVGQEILDAFAAKRAQ